MQGMQRRQFLQYCLGASVVTLLPATLLAEGVVSSARSPEQWRGKVSKQAWDVLFDEATERAWSSALNDEKRAGTYLCAACYLPLFSSEDKYDSGTGWPSFIRPITAEHVGKKRDFKMLLPRTEYHCARCGGHQGHVFNDGPAPTGERWCNNGVALRFVPQQESLPAQRG